MVRSSRLISISVHPLVLATQSLVPSLLTRPIYCLLADIAPISQWLPITSAPVARLVHARVQAAIIVFRLARYGHVVRLQQQFRACGWPIFVIFTSFSVLPSST